MAEIRTELSPATGISASEARKRFASLLRAIEKDPGACFQITVRNRPVAVLRSASLGQGKITSGEALLNAIRKAEALPEYRSRRRSKSIAIKYKDILYGPKRPSSSRKRS